MRIKSVELNNFRHHRHRQIDLAPGVNIIQGPMGCGKSSVIGALSFGLLGQVPGTSSKDTNISWGADDGSVALEFEDAGVTGKVTRHLASSRCSLKFGDETLKSSTTVQGRLLDLLGVDSDQAEQVVFVHQGRLDQLLTSTDAKRQKLLHLLFGTGRMETVAQALGAELTKVAVLMAPPNIDGLRDKLSGVRAQLHAAQTRRETAQTMLASLPEGFAQELADLTAKTSRVKDPASGLNATSDRVKATQAEVNQLAGDLATLSPDRDAARARLEELQAQAAGLSELIARANVIEQVNRRRAILDQKLREVTDRASNPPVLLGAPTEPAGGLQELQNEIGRLQAGVQEAWRHAHSFGQDGRCASCGTTRVVDEKGESHGVRELAERYTQKATQDKQRAAELTTARDAYQRARAEYEKSKTAYDLWNRDLDQELGRLTQEISQLPPEEPVPDVAAARAAVQEMATLQARVKSLDASCQHLEVTLATRQETLLGLQRTLQTLQELDAGCDPARLAELRQLTAEKLRLETEIAQSTGEEGPYRAHAEQLEQQIAEAQMLQERAANQLKYRHLVESAKDIFHREQLPAAMIRCYFEKLNLGWNQTLELLDVPFSASLNPDFSITLQFPDGVTSADQASGGQRACASIAMILEINRRFAHQAGLLVLDEPTYGLDPDHIDRMADLLRNTQAYAEATGLQVILVTHESKLAEGFDNVINLN